ncbi:putative MFS family arabinose efflux permease [Streptomyces sp. PanSC19]|uniref:MFS transporter n=1 Tax=Streptomyces sp. PanSC19 TaxID=1520455 RepID=UPI000F4A3C03|nr:MFS transporter [Streptomyces sp. PanSC19]ROQ36379.1 putative MFS family arabinose efflux permease [Streptomyces sp. PanSC19]
MSPAPSPHTPERSSDPALLRRVALSSLLGTVIEYYDFLLYGTMAALVFGELFFPESDPAVGTIAAFGTLAAGYVARPLGGAVFGHFGDRLGRKSMLVLTMALMGVASFLIGVLPTYGTIGVAAPVLLVLFRVVQGVAIGGEWAGATLMVVEHADPRRRGLWSGVMQMGSPIGFLLSTVAVTLASLLPRASFLSWGWRVPFLFSAVLLGVGLYVRVSVTESPLFQRAAREREAGAASGVPLAQVLRRPRNLVLACAVGIGPFALTALISTFMLTYATAIGYATSEVMTGLLFTSVTGLVSIPLFSALSDHVGRRAVVLAGAAGVVLLAFPVYALVDARSPALLVLGMVLGQVVQSAMYAPLGPLLSEMFGTRVRYTGASLGYQLAALIGGGFTPVFAGGLLSSGDVRSTPLAVLAVVCGLVTALAVWRTAETRGRDLAAEDPAAARQSRTRTASRGAEA